MHIYMAWYDNWKKMIAKNSKSWINHVGNKKKTWGEKSFIGFASTHLPPPSLICAPLPLMSYDPIATPYAHMWQKMCQFWVGLSVFAWLLLLLNGWKLLWVKKKITLWTFVNTEWIFCSIVSSSSTLCPKVNK